MPAAGPDEDDAAAAGLQRLGERDAGEKVTTGPHPAIRVAAGGRIRRGHPARARARAAPRPREHDHHRRAAVGDERQREPLRRQAAEDDADVERALEDDQHGRPEREQARERIGMARRDPEPARADDDEERHHDARAHEPELLADDREDEVGVRAGRKNIFCSLWPSPTPDTPPEPNEMSDWRSWKPIPCGSFV
jgi:hypothetical protein